ncbi:MAG: DUF4256 domain-containing protein [Bacteroidales bacterium]|nr:DUF4256 domain-containing protein [Bacteroidales bacterium]MBN2699795.1 DUF4256 domain-containing protein [Bacteroidales bacterium]
MENKKELTSKQSLELLQILETRFGKNMHRHKGFKWSDLQTRLEKNPGKLWSLNEMEKTGGEPDVLAYDKKSDEYIFYDCSKESPKGRRSVCYDPEALASRKENKPGHSATGMAGEMGIELLAEEEYYTLQQSGPFDTKTSSWILTPGSIRELGGAIFGDRRYGKTFIYHNSAESYYAARGFRGLLRV